MNPRTTTLKSNPARTVTLVEAAPGPPRVVKRFHHPHPLQGLRDRFRARAEYRLLDHLWRRGVHVPRPLAVGACAASGPAPTGAPGGWEVEMEWVPGAGSLEGLLDAPGTAAAGGVSWTRLSAALGRLLAGLHAAGVDHADLHAGNAVVAADGTPFLVDFDKARLRRRLPAGLLFRDLLAVATVGRETLAPRLRTRFLVAWHRALPPELARAAGPVRRLAGDVEAAARGARRSAIERGAGRWLRTSSLCAVERTGGRVVVRRRGGRASEGTDPFATRPGRWVDSGDAEAVTRRWSNCARLVEHHLPVVEPRVLEREGRRARASYLAGPGGPVARGTRGASVPSAARGHLLGLLHDRGLDPPALDRLWARSDGEYVLLPPEGLDALDPAAELSDERRFRALAGELDADSRAAYLLALSAAFDMAPRPGPRASSSAATRTSDRAV